MFEQGNEDRSPKELITDLYKAFESFRRKMEDPSYIQIEGAIKQLMENQVAMKNDISDLKQKLLNPYDGVVVKVRENTDFIKEQKKIEEEMEKIIDEHMELMRFKAMVTKIGWALLTGVGGIGTYLITQFLEHAK